MPLAPGGVLQVYGELQSACEAQVLKQRPVLSLLNSPQVSPVPHFASLLLHAVMQNPFPTMACDSQTPDSHALLPLHVAPDFALPRSFVSHLRVQRLQPTVPPAVWQSASELHSGRHEDFEPSLSQAWPSRQPVAPLHESWQNVLLPSTSSAQVLFALQPVETPFWSRVHVPELVQ